MTEVLLTSQLNGTLTTLGETLNAAGFTVLAQASVDHQADCIVASPAEFLKDVKAAKPSERWQQPVVLIAAKPNVKEAVRTLQLGASDYLDADVGGDELIAAIERAIHTAHGTSSSANQDAKPLAMVGECPAMIALKEQIHKVANTDSSVLIFGESGTGKELVARALHSASPRHVRPMITLNCASVPSALIETELFGALDEAGEKRTGLVQAADGGTLFLDEIADLPLAAQARLLQVVESSQVRPVGSTARQEVDVRVIGATHRRLEQLTQHEQFRQDLYYRLGVITLVAPALRDRGDDILRLADSFLAKTCKRLERPGLTFTSSARSTMSRYRWPGNVRELSNAVERAVLLVQGDEISETELAIELPQPAPSEEAATNTDQTSLEDYFVKFVTDHQDQLTETELAERLGISRKSLWERRQRLNIPRKRTKKRGPRRDRS